ncbi:MAG: hypothetical protein HC893_01480 [Chloroflexaceae bacterium]|nr:hypothetical protein [Chloroflexaceae bacterium]
MYRNHYVLLLLLIVFTVATVPMSAVPIHANDLAASEFGVNSHIASRYNNYHLLEWAADVLDQSGAGWVREDFHWFWIEPEPGRFQWEYYDRMVELVHARGINIIGVLGHPPGWATPHPHDAIPMFRSMSQTRTSLLPLRGRLWSATATLLPTGRSGTSLIIPSSGSPRPTLSLMHVC